MSRRLIGLRNVVLLAVAWAVAWAPIAILVGVFVIDPDNSMDEMWIVVGAYPAFICAVIFSGLLALAGTRLDEVSLTRAGVWGAIAGLMVGAIPFTLGTPDPDNADWLGLAVMGSFALMSAASAVASSMLVRFRRRERRRATANAA